MAGGLSTEGGLNKGSGLIIPTGGLLDRVTPLDSPNCVFWIDANNGGSITLASGRATNVSDLSGNRAHFTPPGSGPQWIENVHAGYAGLLMYDNTTSRYLSTPDSAMLKYSTFHGMGVFKRAGDLAASETIMAKYTTTGNQRENRAIILSGDGLQGVASDTSGGIGGQTASLITPNSTGTVANGAAAIFDYYYDGTNMGISVNNETPSVLPMTGPMFNGTSPFFIGARDGGADPANIYVLTLFFYTRVLTEKHRLKQLRALSQRYRIAIA